MGAVGEAERGDNGGQRGVALGARWASDTTEAINAASKFTNMGK